MLSRVVNMTREIKKGGSIISRWIKVGVITIRPFECILNVTHSLLKHDALIPSARQFRCPVIIPSNINDVLFWKILAGKGGGSWKLLVNPVNVVHLQSMRHVKPVCEFTANDSRINMSAAIFRDGNRCKLDMEARTSSTDDVCCCMLILAMRARRLW